VCAVPEQQRESDNGECPDARMAGHKMA